MPHSGPVSVSTAARRLIELILAFARSRPPDQLEDMRGRLEQILADESDESVRRLIERTMTTGDEFTYYPPDPLARKLTHEVARFAVPTESSLLHAEALIPLRGKPMVLLSNHLSYSDANLVEVLLEREGLAEIADRLTVVVGPKVYSEPFRRFSSLAFGTVKTPQSSARSSEDAVMPVREVARVARETIAVAVQRQARGDAMLIFVEGTRSRSASMQRALPGVARYFEERDRIIVPIAIHGSERFVPVGDERLHNTHVTCRIGRPVEAGALADLTGASRTLRIDAIGVAIARLLPPEYRGVYAEELPERSEARAIADAVFGKPEDQS